MDPLPVHFDDYRKGVVQLRVDLDTNIKSAIAQLNPASSAMDASSLLAPANSPPANNDPNSMTVLSVLNQARPLMEYEYAKLQPLSYSLPLQMPVLYEIYRPAVVAMEARVGELVMGELMERARVAVLNDIMQPTRFAKLKAVRAVTDSILVPFDHDLKEYGRAASHGRIKKRGSDTEEPYRIELDAKKASLALQTASVTAVYQAMSMNASKGVLLVSDVVSERVEASEDKQRRLTELLEIEFPRVLRILMETSQEEAQNIVPAYESDLRALLEDINDKYLAMVMTAATLNELLASYVVLLTTRLDQVSSLFESYVAAAPIIYASQNVPAAPLKRDYSVLMQTPSAGRLIQLVEASRRVLPPASTKDLKFLNEIPRNLVDQDLQPIQPDSRQPHAMDRVQRFFVQQTPDKSRLVTEYQTLKARTVAAAAMAAAEKAPRRK